MTDSLASRLERHVRTLAGEIGERHVERPEALHAAADYIRGEMESMGCAVRAQGYHANGVWSENLEVEIAGAAAAKQIVIAGAHYDTVPGSPGADDNASGVAAVLEIARELRQARLAGTVRLVAFVNEESPFFFFGEMGSKVYASEARTRGDHIRVMLSLEMLGCYTDEPGSQDYPPLLRWFYPDRGNFIAFVSNLPSRDELNAAVAAFKNSTDFPVEYLASPWFVPGVALSDHLSFWREGYPALMVTDTAFYRYRHYHRSTDTPEKLDYARMARVVDGLAGTIATLADAN